jgi:homoserine O-acetyltransferase/O-succinyltransferase
MSASISATSISVTSPATSASPAPGVRSARDSHVREEILEGVLELPAPFALFHGGRVSKVRVAWRLAGAAGAPVVAALGGISAHRVVYSSAQSSGWWNELVGPGRPLDSSRYRILGFDYLGGSGDTTGPGRQQGSEYFPSVSTFDQAELLARILDILGIATLHAIVGASYGGMVGLALAQRFASRLRGLLVISAAHRTHPMSTAWRSVQRAIVRRAIEHGDGAAGLELARALAMATYRSAEEFAARFPSGPVRRGDGTFDFPVAQYLFARGADYAAQYSPRAFLCLSESIDLHSVEPGAVYTPTVIVSVRQDQLVPTGDLRELGSSLGGAAHLVELDSPYGHDAFLKERARLAPAFATTLDRAAERGEVP